MLERPKRFVNEHLRWAKAGFPLRPVQLVTQLFIEQCKPCENFEGGNALGVCKLCTCAVRREGVVGNKLAMATTRCPLPEPKWTEYEGATEFAEYEKTQSNQRCC